MSGLIAHGHVKKNPNGIKARCGGPSLCHVCQQEFFSLTLEEQQKYLEEQKAIKSAAETNRQAALEGKRAWRNQVPIDKNPYSSDSSAYLAWEQSWLTANSSYISSSPEGL